MPLFSKKPKTKERETAAKKKGERGSTSKEDNRRENSSHEIHQHFSYQNQVVPQHQVFQIDCQYLAAPANLHTDKSRSQIDFGRKDHSLQSVHTKLLLDDNISRPSHQRQPITQLQVDHENDYYHLYKPPQADRTAANPQIVHHGTRELPPPQRRVDQATSVFPNQNTYGGGRPNNYLLGGPTRLGLDSRQSSQPSVAYSKEEDAEMASRQTRIDTLSASDRRAQDRWVQQRLRVMGVCPAGFEWRRQGPGYRCRAGAHYISDEDIAAGRSAQYRTYQIGNSDLTRAHMFMAAPR